MKEQFLEYEDALALRELGFNELCFGHWVDGTLDLITRNINDYPPMYVEVVKAPLYQQAFRWFREKYQLDSFCRTLDSSSNSYWKISKLYDDGNIKGYSGFHKSYEEAELECVRQLIKIVKNEL